MCGSVEAETYHSLCSFSKVLEGLRRLVLFAWNKPLAGPRGFRPAVNQLTKHHETVSATVLRPDLGFMMSAERINAPTVPVDYLHPPGVLQALGISFSSRPPSFHRPSGVTHDQGRDAIPSDQTPADDDILALQAGRQTANSCRPRASSNRSEVHMTSCSSNRGTRHFTRMTNNERAGLDETGSARRIFERSQTNGKPQLALVSPDAAFPPAYNFHRISGEAKLGISVLEWERKGTGLDCLTSAPADDCRRALMLSFHAGFCAGAPRFCGVPALCGEKRSGLESALEDNREGFRPSGSTTGSLVVSGWVDRDRGAGLRKAEEKLNSRQWEITQAATRLFEGRRGESSHVFVKRDAQAQAGSTEGRSWMEEDERDSRN
ncbi:hypothetical protein BO85DRAFT_497916 [Aspergillus piperis CBS 112811]|uniref:Uncharacterized protein n=1 Tax=Aspergillus piperis CBS 112811 TaxID=1448313 RepID=A0A8G1VJJ6_9EURO|nr:hypothetical protein BO85DRAFT_497916 [Aspergillus piperis CBS 112811]RAH55699.1 hypothetical protein BO85DRAFT_497916 [Aspergillus piperis CBS 112811]